MLPNHLLIEISKALARSAETAPRLVDIERIFVSVGSDWHLLMPIIFRVMDPANIPDSLTLEAEPVHEGFRERLRCVWFFLDFIAHFDIIYQIADVSAHLWDRMWCWIRIFVNSLSSIPHIISRDPSTILVACVAVMGRLARHQPTLEVMIRTHGTLSVVTRAWSTLANIGNGDLLRLGVMATNRFWMALPLVLPERMDEIVNAAGMSLDDLARATVNNLEPIRATLTSRSSAPALTFMPYILFIDSMMSAAEEDFTLSLINYDIAGVIAYVLYLMKDDLSEQTHPIIETAFRQILYFLEFPEENGQCAVAVEECFMQSVITLAQNDTDANIQALVAYTFSTVMPRAFIQHRVVQALGKQYDELQKVVASAPFQSAAVYASWTALDMLLIERLQTLAICNARPTVSFKQCDSETVIRIRPRLISADFYT